MPPNTSKQGNDVDDISDKLSVERQERMKDSGFVWSYTDEVSGLSANFTYAKERREFLAFSCPQETTFCCWSQHSWQGSKRRPAEGLLAIIRPPLTLTLYTLTFTLLSPVASRHAPQAHHHCSPRGQEVVWALPADKV